MRVGSLFSGIGGLDLGLERAGMEVVWQVENDPYAQKVLKKHWPQVQLHGDVREVHSRPPQEYDCTGCLDPVDLICGGFPCQDLSRANPGGGAGLDGARSGLWREFARIIGEVRPSWVLVENVDGAPWKRWVPVVRGNLASLGYACVPIRVRAADVGAPFLGSRVFVVASSDSHRESTMRIHAQARELPEPPRPSRQDWGHPPPRALGVAHGVPNRMDRLRGCGNAVVPQVAEYIGRLILGAQ